MMSLQFLDSFEHWSSIENGVGKYTYLYATTTGSFFRTGSKSLHVNFSTQASKTAGLSAHSTWIYGFGFRPTSFTSTYDNIIAVTSNGVVVGLFTFNTNPGTFQYTRVDAGASKVVLGTSPTVTLTPGVWTHIQFKVVIASGSSGSVVVKLNDSTVWTLSSVNTQSSHGSAASGTADGFSIGSTIGITNDNNYYGGSVYQLDDFYVCNGSGSVNNDFLGDARIEYLAPNGVGNSTAWTPVGAAANWDCVDELGLPDGDTTYVTGTGSGTRDLYALADMATNPATIHGIQTVQARRKLTGGSVSTKPVVRIGGTNYAGASVACPDSYAYTTEIRETNPNTGTAWTKTTVDAMETGIEIA